MLCVAINKNCIAVPVVIQKSYLPKNWLNLLVTLKPFKLKFVQLNDVILFSFTLKYINTLNKNKDYNMIQILK